MKSETVELIFQVILIILALYLAFVKSYFQEKGKNLATLDDIEEITSKVESIKNEFIKETERLKIQLHYTNQIKFSLKTEEIKSLIDYYEKYNFWLNFLMDLFFSGYDKDNLETLSSLDERINNAYFQFLLAEAKMKLFHKDKSLNQNADDMKLRTLQLHSYISISIPQYYKVLFDFTTLQARTTDDQFLAEHQKLLDNQLKFFEAFRTEKLKHYKEIVELSVKFQQLCYQKLTDLMNSDAELK